MKFKKVVVECSIIFKFTESMIKDKHATKYAKNSSIEKND